MRVALTEQPQLVPLLEKNIDRNFPAGAAEAGTRPDALALSWGTAEAEAFLAARGGQPFDTILVCDCVFEPLYGDSWKLLCKTLAALCPAPEAVPAATTGPGAASTDVLIACERRDEDGIPEFLALLGTHFEVSVAFTNYADAELLDLLSRSHVKGNRKPLRVFRATRRPVTPSAGAAAE